MIQFRLKLYFLLPLLHVIAVASLFLLDDWLTALLIGVLLYYPILIIGYTIGYHKLFSHRAFTPKPWFPLLAVYCGLLSWHSTPYASAITHRIHHKYSDTDLDPSNANRGFIYAWFGWMYCYKIPRREYAIIKDLRRDWPWLDKVSKYETIVPLATYAIAFLFGPAVGCGVIIASLLAYHGPLLINGFLHKKCSLECTEPVNHAFWAKWINPAANHKQHHENPSSCDYSTGYAKDWSAVLIERFFKA